MLGGCERDALKSDVVVTNEAGVAIVSLNRPRMRNAITLAMWRELKAVFDALGQDRDVRAVVLTGASKDFSVGADVSEFDRIRDNKDQAAANEIAVDACSNAIADARKPVIVAVSSAAAAIAPWRATSALPTTRLCSALRRRNFQLFTAFAASGGCLRWPGLPTQSAHLICRRALRHCSRRPSLKSPLSDTSSIRRCAVAILRAPAPIDSPLSITFAPAIEAGTFTAMLWASATAPVRATVTVSSTRPLPKSGCRSLREAEAERLGSMP